MEENPKNDRWWIISHEELIDRLYPWPFLRQLKAERRFRYAFLITLFFFIVIFGAIPKVWIVTPEGMNPVVKVRGIDFLEAQIFRQIALNFERRGERAEAWQYWRQACAHNPTSISLLRSSVRNVWELPPRNYAYFSDGLNRAIGLTVLDSHNPESLYCAARTYAHFRLFELVIDLAAKSPVESREVAVLATQAKLLIGDHEGYAKGRQAFQTPPDRDQFRLFDQAYDASWSTGAAAVEGLSQLQKDAENIDVEQRTLGLQLLLLVASSKSDAPAFERALSALHDDHRDEPLQHVQLWQLLDRAGNRAAALALAAKAELVPISSTELVGVAGGFELLGMNDRAIAYLDRYAYPIGANSSVWLHFGDLLIHEQRWEDLRRAALDMRRSVFAGQELAGYSHFLEGLALTAVGSSQDAESTFKKVPQLSIPRPDLALLVAAKMADLGALDSALQLALQQENLMQAHPEFWGLLLQLATRKKDSSLLLRAAQKVYELSPGNPQAINAYASALAVHEIQPELLLKLAQDLKTQFPDDFSAALNYAFALIANRRTNEASIAVLDLPTEKLSKVDTALVALARGRLGSLRQDWTFAYTNYNQVEPELLYKCQADTMIRLREEAALELDRAKAQNQVP